MLPRRLRPGIPALHRPLARALRAAGLAGLALLALPLSGCQGLLGPRGPAGTEEDPFVLSDWPAATERVWIGPGFYGNRLQDWQIRDGRLECVTNAPARPMRVAQRLVERIEPGLAIGDRAPGARAVQDGEPAEGAAASGGSAPRPEALFRTSVRIGSLDEARGGEGAWAGFLVGAGSRDIDPRLTALCHHRPAPHGGLIAAVDGAGHVRFRDFEHNVNRGAWAVTGPLHENECREIPAVDREGPGLDGRPMADVTLHLTARPLVEDGLVAGWRLELEALDGGDELLSRAALEWRPPAEDAPAGGPGTWSGGLDGSLGLCSHRGPDGSDRGYWFRDWTATGSGLDWDASRSFGPVLATPYTVHDGTLKLLVQMPALGPQDSRTVRLETIGGSSTWSEIATSEIREDCFTALFRIEGWDSERDRDFRVAYDLRTGPESTERRTFRGTIRKDPRGGRVRVATFTGNKNFTGGIRWDHGGVWFPHAELVAAVASRDPDLLFFSGDQIYESDLTGVQRRPVDKAMLDYHDKWWRWCWSFQELTRRTPTICIPDDHDVYHGNIWGAGGRHADRQDDGGYTMPSRFVKAVERTQTDQLPDPYDPTPIEQGIEVYYTDLTLGGVSFAILEDRKWKSSPTPMMPEGDFRNGWGRNREFDPRSPAADPDGAVLLGARQLAFLEDWAADWGDGVWMKAALSQTIFANVATLPEEALSDGAVPGLAYPPPGYYPQGDALAADGDSNGWPKSGRDRAVRKLRKGFAVHLAGDQHLGSLIRYGVEEFDDAGWAFCVPSIANTWPRRWFPPMEGEGREPGMPFYTGRYLDGWGNHITVHAVSNPRESGIAPTALNDRAPGFGIVDFEKDGRTVTFHCWPRHEDPTSPRAEEYLGWPKTVGLLDNRGGTVAGHLTEIESGRPDPVVQVVDEETGEVVYTLRIEGRTFRPFVFAPGTYTVRWGEPGAWEERRGQVVGG